MPELSAFMFTIRIQEAATFGSAEKRLCVFTKPKSFLRQFKVSKYLLMLNVCVISEVLFTVCKALVINCYSNEQIFIEAVFDCTTKNNGPAFDPDKQEDFSGLQTDPCSFSKPEQTLLKHQENIMKPVKPNTSSIIDRKIHFLGKQDVFLNTFIQSHKNAICLSWFRTIWKKKH